jgi:hypothetical protein
MQNWDNHIVGISAFEISFQIIMSDGNISSFDVSDIKGEFTDHLIP